ncbi:MAG TPA: sulfatase-like hydrolase/transferase [Allosphingosinicella sp.]
MHAEIAAAPAASTPRRWEAVLARLSLPAVVFLTLVFELALAERKFAIFAGGFGQSRAIDTAGELAAFLPALLAAHAFLFYLFYRLVRRLHGRRADTPLFHFNFFYLATFLGSAVLVAKYQALSYFSDALSFQVVRNMGGGSIIQALLYTLNEGALMLFVALGAFGVYALLRVLLRRRLCTAPLPDGTRLSGRMLAAALVAVPLILFAASEMRDVRSALARFNAPYVVTALFDEASDVDRDGFGFFSAHADSHPFDGSRHPFALDVPNNGLDEDGFAGDLVLADPAPAAAPPPVRIAGERPHVVLIVLESTRGDIIGRRFRGRPVAPNLEALAASGTSAPEAFSHAGFTALSLKTLFTGRLVPEGPTTSLFEAFRANGYRTGAFSAQAEDFGGIAETVGMRRSDVFVDAEALKNERVYSLGSESSLRIDDSLVVREFDRHFGRAEAWNRPNFVYLNLQSAHFPYDHPGMGRPLGIEPLPRGDIKAANRARLEATYWNAAAYADAMVGAVVRRLQSLGVWDRTLLVVTADHGESLFEDGFLGHGHMINRRQNHIPFVMNRRVVLPSPIGLADVRNIVLRAAGADLPAQPSATPGGVFQYVGSLDRPSSIGLADGAGRYTVFSFDNEQLWTARAGRWQDYAALAPGSAERRAADALIAEWGRQRWLNRAGG